MCIFAYGQTGSGKTHTMQGGADEAAGINPRALRRLFDAVREKREMAALGKGGKADDGWSYEVSVSYLGEQSGEQNPHCPVMWDRLGKVLVEHQGLPSSVSGERVQCVTLLLRD